jgi:UDP-N-acetylmuramoylalanine--D-glutamate ligase
VVREARVPAAVADTREAPPNLAALQAEGIDAEFVGGPFTPALLDGGIDIVGLSPACRRSSGARRAARGRERTRDRGVGRTGIVRAGAARARHERLPAEGAGDHRHQRQDHDDEPHRLAVPARGQEGRRGRQHQPGDARPARERDRRAALPDVWVLELSSFQLETARTFAPDAAAMLNITQDHLDWHGSIDAYAAAKAASSARRPRAC